MKGGIYIMSKFSERFRQLKDEKKLTLKELSEALDVSVPNLSYYMKDREPSYDILIRIADYFNVTTDWLIGRTDAKNVSEESIYEQVENALELKDNQRLFGNSKADYLKCQHTLYCTMENLYTLFLFYSYNPSLSNYLSEQINMYIGILHNCINYFNKIYVYTSKDNLLNLIKYGEACADAQKKLLLVTFYNFVKCVSEDDEDIPDNDKEFLKNMIDFLFNDYDKKNPQSEIQDLYERINKFEFDKNIVSKNKFTE